MTPMTPLTEFNRELRNALAYPVALIAAAVALTYGFLVILLPQIATLYVDAGLPPSVGLRLALALREAITAQQTPYLLSGGVALLAALILASRESDVTRRHLAAAAIAVTKRPLTLYFGAVGLAALIVGFCYYVLFALQFNVVTSR
jgi:type II secretory pathway component PulF